jgi:hypothetical protein
MQAGKRAAPMNSLRIRLLREGDRIDPKLVGVGIMPCEP